MGKLKPANRNLYWSCPYFQWDGKTCVNCEGGRISIPSEAIAVDYMYRYCASAKGWKNCTVAKALTKCYEEEHK